MGQLNITLKHAQAITFNRKRVNTNIFEILNINIK